MSNILRITLVVACSWAASCSSVAAEEIAAKSPISFFATTFLDTVTNLDGGISQETAVLFDQTVGVELDLEQTVGMRNSRCLISGHGHVGEDPSKIVGDYQFTDSLEAPSDLELYETWIESEFDSLTLRAGLLDYNSTFQYLSVTWDFFNSSFALSPELGGLAVSTYPFLGLGASATQKFENGIYASAGLFDGLPVESGRQRGTRIQLNSEQGILGSFEAGYQPREHDKIAIGGWLRTTESNYLSQSEYSSNSGAYIVTQWELIAEPKVLGFAQAATSDSERNLVRDYLGTGFAFLEPIAGRSADRLLFGLNRAWTSDPYKQTSGISAAAETVVELSYLFELFDGFGIQPDLQFVDDPVGIPGASDAWVAGLRLRYTMHTQ